MQVCVMVTLVGSNGFLLYFSSEVCKNKNMFEDFDDAWLGAVLEKQGTIGIHQQAAARYYLRIVVTGKDEAWVRRVHEIAGVGKISHSGGGWCWVVTCSKALIVLNRAMPYLKKRRDHVLVAREFYARGACACKRKGMSEAQRRVRYACYLAMKTLNRRAASG